MWLSASNWAFRLLVCKVLHQRKSDFQKAFDNPHDPPYLKYSGLQIQPENCQIILIAVDNFMADLFTILKAECRSKDIIDGQQEAIVNTREGIWGDFNDDFDIKLMALSHCTQCTYHRSKSFQ